MAESPYPKGAKVKWRRRAEAIVAAGVQTCAKCSCEKPLSEFPTHRKNRAGQPRYSYCKACHSEYQRFVSLKRKYGITAEEYERVLRHQNGGCAICGKAPKAGSSRLAVDHCHKTGLIRGLLCWICNRLLGSFRDDPERLKACIRYLTAPPATAVFGASRYTAPGRIDTKKRAKLLQAMRAAS